jgi:hypothetical protein
VLVQGMQTANPDLPMQTPLLAGHLLYQGYF